MENASKVHTDFSRIVPRAATLGYTVDAATSDTARSVPRWAEGSPLSELKQREARIGQYCVERALDFAALV